MMDYRSTNEKLVFSLRMVKVKENILTRLKPYEIREGTKTSPAKAEGKNPFVDVFRNNPHVPYIINLANAITLSWMETPFMIFPNEAIVGITRPCFPVYEHFSWGLVGVESVLNDKSMQKEEAEILCKRLEPLTRNHITDEGERIFGKEKYEALCTDRVFSAGGFQGHTIPNYVTLMANGLDGMLDLINKYAIVNDRDEETHNFYEANRIIIKGMSAWLQAYSNEAARLASEEKDSIQKKYYEEISANCAFVAHNKPETLYQAVQLMWCLSLWDWVDCVGRVDQYLYPFYEKSVREGDVISAEEAITSIMFKLWENGSHNITVSGVHPEDGSDATTDLTYLMLQILRNIHDTHPRMSIRIHKDSPKELMNLAVQMWSEGMCDPTVVSDENVIPGLMRIGVPIEDARDYSMLGCQEIEIPGKSNFGCEDGKFNLAKVFEYAMHDGRSTSHPELRVGPATGEFVDFETFEDFFDAFKTQLKFFTAHFCHLCDMGQEIRAANVAKLVKTPFTTGCLEKGKSHDMGGPIYNFGVVETAGFAAVADSFTAVKKLVFDEKKISKQTLVNALNANFKGYEKERQMLLNMAPKFGNDNFEADAMAVRVLDLFWDECGKYKSIRGDVYTGACSLLEGGIYYGKCTGALPDGRFKGEPLGNSIGPRPGADKNGVSAMLSSVAKLPLEKGVGGTTLNVILTTKLLSNPDLRENIAATMRAYLMNGGQMAQITTANLEDLLDAQEHPERHGDLIVRIGGFSIQFVQLEKDSQDEIISRYDGEPA